MALRVETVTIDARDPEGLARWWADLLRSSARPDDGDWVVEADGATLLFGTTPDDKVVKNRVHLDLRPTTATPRSPGPKPSAPGASTSAKASRPGWCSRTPRATSSASFATGPP